MVFNLFNNCSVNILEIRNIIKSRLKSIANIYNFILKIVDLILEIVFYALNSRFKSCNLFCKFSLSCIIIKSIFKGSYCILKIGERLNKFSYIVLVCADVSKSILKSLVKSINLVLECINRIRKCCVNVINCTLKVFKLTVKQINIIFKRICKITKFYLKSVHFTLECREIRHKS